MGKTKTKLIAGALAVATAGFGASAFQTSYQGEVIRVIDGDTVEARIEVLPDMFYTVSVRERGLDTPEKRRGRFGAQCEEEREAGLAVSKLISEILPPGTIIGIENVGLGKYAGRFVGDIQMIVDANEPPVDLGDWLISQGLAVPYDGGTKIKPWCPVDLGGGADVAD